MRRIAATTAIIALFSPFVAKAADAASPAPAPASTEPAITDIRREMLLEYRYAPPGAKVTPLPSSLHSDAPAPVPAAADVVRMEPFEVRDARASNAASLRLAQDAPKNPASVAATRLGIGTHQMRLGKVRLFVNTIFYVPVLMGFDW